MKNEKYSNGSRAHIRYKLKDGTIVPGVTTVIGTLGWGKSALIKWANNLGLKGIDSTKYVDEKAQAGTLAHRIVTDHLQGIKTDTSEYSKLVIDAAENSALSFFEWMKTNKLKPIMIEKPLISETLRFGGTLDIYAENNGVLELIDLKTGKGIYDEAALQLAALEYLLIENGYKVESKRIVNIPRSEDESFMEKTVGNTKIAMEIFKNCLSIYQLKKSLDFN